MEAVDAGLVARARAGDEEAFRALVARHHHRVYRAAYAVTADADDAAEAAQDAWVKAWGALRGFRGDAAVTTWLTRLALNAATDVVRRRHRRERIARLAALLPGPRPTIDRVDDRDALRVALGRLGDDARRLVALRFGLGLTVDEIAAVLGHPAGTVKSHLHAAAASLRRSLREDRPTLEDVPPPGAGVGRDRSATGEGA